MLTKADIKFVKSLNEKKERYANKLFVAEGNKLLIEILNSKISVTRIFANENWLNLNQKLVGKNIEITLLKQEELTRLSNLQSTREVIALCKIPEYEMNLAGLSGLTLALDTIQDPGNLGTIIRVADWFGIKNILCSNETVDCYNPKVVQSTMGSISRIRLFYGDLSNWLKSMKQPILAANMEGVSVHEYTFPENAVLIIGNEGIGIGTHLKPLIQQNICIPRRGSAESLNAAIAAAILMDRYAGLHF